MTIAVGQKLPETEFMTLDADQAPTKTNTAAVFAGKKIALFAVPGAYTPTCSARHLPGFRDHAEAFAAKGVDAIVCTSVNDIFVLKAWAKDNDVLGRFVMLADGNGAFAKALGLEMDASGFGMGARSRRYSMLVEDGVVTQLNVEPGPSFEVSAAEVLLGQLA